MNVVKNDLVLVISGNARGRQGRVLKTFPKVSKIVVEGINLMKQHSKPSQQIPQGGIIEKEGTIHVSNVMVICPKCGNATRVKHKVLETGKIVRVCRNCAEMLSVND